jgi:hypothetical protein
LKKIRRLLTQKRIVVVGESAAGPKAAAHAHRMDEKAKNNYFSYGIMRISLLSRWYIDGDGS